MNNKGQSLVLFILIIPILLGIMVLVIDVGRAFNTKNKINSIIEMVMEYGLESDYSEEELEELIDYNIDSNKYLVEVEDDKINIRIEDNVEGIISKIIDVDGFLIASEYIGYMENDKKVIEKVR